MDQYEEYLTDGVKAMLETYPTTFRVPVYQTRRTHAVPDWVAENTRENAVNAEIVGQGEGLDGAFGGYPFPILHGNDEQKAWQAVWNHLTRWRGVNVTRRSSEVAVQTNGDYSLVTSQQEAFFNYYNPEGGEEDLDNVIFYYLSFTQSPPRLAGGAILIHETLNQIINPRNGWGYNAGQRRVRRAPNLGYDSPIAAADNLRTADDTDIFNGALDRYNWNYEGKREIYIPYNNYRIGEKGLPYEEILGISHLNPDLTRWELHRVHVVEATLKDGERHIYGKRRFYIDEDSWNTVLLDQYDGRGELWRVTMGLPKIIMNFRVCGRFLTSIMTFRPVVITCSVWTQKRLTPACSPTRSPIRATSHRRHCAAGVFASALLVEGCVPAHRKWRPDIPQPQGCRYVYSYSRLCRSETQFNTT